MSNPQSPEQRRSERGGATPQEAASEKLEQDKRQGPGGPARAHGTDKGEKGGGEGGGTPPDQQPDHP
jgi:hypothetical protein